MNWWPIYVKAARHLALLLMSLILLLQSIFPFSPAIKSFQFRVSYPEVCFCLSKSLVDSIFTPNTIAASLCIINQFTHQYCKELCSCIQHNLRLTDDSIHSASLIHSINRDCRWSALSNSSTYLFRTLLCLVVAFFAALHGLFSCFHSPIIFILSPRCNIDAFLYFNCRPRPSLHYSILRDRPSIPVENYLSRTTCSSSIQSAILERFRFER